HQLSASIYNDGPLRRRTGNRSDDSDARQTADRERASRRDLFARAALHLFLKRRGDIVAKDIRPANYDRNRWHRIFRRCIFAARRRAARRGPVGSWSVQPPPAVNNRKAPSSNIQAPEKHQAPNIKPGSLALGASLFG